MEHCGALGRITKHLQTFWRAGGGQKRKGSGPRSRLWRWSERNPALAGLALAVVVLAGMLWQAASLARADGIESSMALAHAALDASSADASLAAGRAMDVDTALREAETWLDALPADGRQP